MRFVFEFTVPLNTPKATPEELEVQLVPGIIRRIEIGFPPGCADMVDIVLRDGLFQFSPVNPDGSHHWDHYTEQFELNYKLAGPAPIVTLMGWSPGTVFDHTVTVRFDVEVEGEDDRAFLVKLLGQQSGLSVKE